MSEPVGRLDTIVINVLDLGRQREFWQAVLGVEVAAEYPPTYVFLKPQHPGGVSVALQLVESATEGTRRLHLDLGVTDRDAARARVVELGGSHVTDHTLGTFGWSVMADPEGNEFCIAVHD
jgi:predicted enzyme related to lactoylglutathione lyase